MFPTQVERFVRDACVESVLLFWKSSPFFLYFFRRASLWWCSAFQNVKKFCLFPNWGWWVVVVVSTMTILINPFPENQIRPNNTKTRVLPLHCPVKLFVTVSSFQNIPPVSASVALSIVCITKLNCVKFWKYSASLTSISDWKVTTLPKNWRSMRIRNDVITLRKTIENNWTQKNNA